MKPDKSEFFTYFQLGQWHYMNRMPLSQFFSKHHAEYNNGYAYERAEHLSLPNMEHLR